MTPKYQPVSGNAPGPFYVVEGWCASCDVPLEYAPDLMDYQGSQPPGHCRFRRQPQTEEELRQAIKAVACCCTLAIRYAGSDKAILDRIAAAPLPQSCDGLPESDRVGFPPNLS